VDVRKPYRVTEVLWLDFGCEVRFCGIKRGSLRATRSKSQPPHLVFGYIYYCLLNLSSDHLLSGVNADYYETRCGVNRGNCGYRGQQQGSYRWMFALLNPGKSAGKQDQRALFIAAGAGTGSPIPTLSGVVQIAFPPVSSSLFMVTFSCRCSTSTSR
jgi:hypothetical protein